MLGDRYILDPFRTDSIPIGLVRLLYSAFPQVASVTTGVVIGAWLAVWRTGSSWDWLLAWVAVGMAVSRLGLLVAFHQHVGNGELSSASARRWECSYGVCSLVMGIVIAGMSLRALAGTDAGMQLLCLGLTMATCGGQSSTRIACRPWIPISTGSMVLAAFAGGCLLHPDGSYQIVGGLLLLYWFSHFEACRHGGRTILTLYQAKRSIAYRAAHDDLTGLPNRATFRERLVEASAHLKRHGHKYAVLALDLDGFKSVNDTHGHAVGDELLCQIADRMRHTLREGDVVARLGGDEFAVLQVLIPDTQAAISLATRLIAKVSAPYHIEGHTITISMSVGIAVAPDCGDGEVLLRSADKASYEAKRAGKGHYRTAGSS